MKFLRYFFLCWCLSFVCYEWAHADNLSFLDESAITFFTTKDRDLMVANAMNALNRLSDGTKAQWKNPNTGAWGYAIPSKTSRTNGMICRNVTIFNSARGVTGKANYHLCKIAGQWKFV